MKRKKSAVLNELIAPLNGPNIYGPTALAPLENVANLTSRTTKIFLFSCHRKLNWERT